MERINDVQCTMKIYRQDTGFRTFRVIAIIILLLRWNVPVVVTFVPLPIQETKQPQKEAQHSRFVRLVDPVFLARTESKNSEPVSLSKVEECVRLMSTRDIKEELKRLQFSTDNIFEKEGLIRKLVDARMKMITNDDNHEKEPDLSTLTKHDDDDIIHAQLYFTSIADKGTRIAAVNGGGITVNSNQNPYPTIKINANNNALTLTLLLDTACSGFVLRPEVVEKYKLPQLQTPVTMMGAGGTSSATGLTQLNSFSIGSAKFGMFPAAVQDIGALPPTLDGIIGLSFLNRFEAIALDFRTGSIRFYRNRQPSNLAQYDGLNLVARGAMNMIPRLGIYTVDVFMGERGPVKMLVDTGAACTLLNWKGVEQLGLSSTSAAIAPINSAFGAMGSDNIAIALTHRLNVSSKLNLGDVKTNNNYPGLMLKGARLPIDIGRIPVIDNLSSEEVGGILGVDALMKGSVLLLTLKGRSREILLYSTA